VTSVESLTGRRLSGAALDELLARIERDRASASRDERIAALKLKLTDPAGRKVAISLAIQLMAADGILRTSERELIFDMAEGLELDRDEIADTIAELAPKS